MIFLLKSRHTTAMVMTQIFQNNANNNKNERNFLWHIFILPYYFQIQITIFLSDLIWYIVKSNKNFSLDSTFRFHYQGQACIQKFVCGLPTLLNLSLLQIHTELLEPNRKYWTEPYWPYWKYGVLLIEKTRNCQKILYCWAVYFCSF